VFFQPRQAFGKEAFSPQADDLTAGIQALGNLVIGKAFGGMEDHAGAKHLKIRQRIFGGSGFQFTAFLLAELNGKRTCSRHESRCQEKN
jgi:hypothetical protein